jgi:hypothetical protein
LKWKFFKKLAKQKKVFDMKKLVEKCLGRERSDIKQKIEMKRQQTIRILNVYQKLIQETQRIQEKNARDGEGKVTSPEHYLWKCAGLMCQIVWDHLSPGSRETPVKSSQVY